MLGSLLAYSKNVGVSKRDRRPYVLCKFVILSDSEESHSAQTECNAESVGTFLACRLGRCF